jgi:acyl-CoA synthetase (NDP forming)
VSLEPLFRPGSITLIGASHSEEKLGGVILKNLLKFRGRLYPVNPKYTEIMGLKSYPSVETIPDVDLAIIIRPAREVPDIIRGLYKKTKFIIIASSGFAEIGEEALQNEIKEIVKDKNIRILGPNCMGIFNPHERLDTFFLPYERLNRPKKGNIAVVSQSGAILSCLLNSVRAIKKGVSKAIGYGNALDIDESDIYEYLIDDPKTDIVVSYIESIKDGRKFIERAERLSKKKPLVILKAGKYDMGQKAAFSHTGRLAGKYEVFHSILRQFRINEVNDLDELVDSIKAYSCYPEPKKGRNILIITNGGGSGVLAADECMRQGIELKALPEEKAKRLREIFPPFYGINNPIDLTAQVLDRDYITALTELKEYYDAFLIIALPNVNGITLELANMIRDFKKTTSKPIVFHIPQNGVANRLISLLEKINIPVYSSPERAVRAMNILLKRGD